MGVGGKFDSGSRILGGPAPKDMMIHEQEFQLSNAAADSATFKNRKSYINPLGIGKFSS